MKNAIKTNCWRDLPRSVQRKILKIAESGEACHLRIYRAIWHCVQSHFIILFKAMPGIPTKKSFEAFFEILVVKDYRVIAGVLRRGSMMGFFDIKILPEFNIRNYRFHFSMQIFLEFSVMKIYERWSPSFGFWWLLLTVY